MNILSNAMFWMVLSAIMTVVSAILLFKDGNFRRWLRRSFRIRRQINMEEFQKSLEPLQASFREAEERTRKEHESDPNNGKLGYWEVLGIRHNAVVKASSAMEALKKSKSHIDDWEMPKAKFLGEQLPDVYLF